MSIRRDPRTGGRRSRSGSDPAERFLGSWARPGTDGPLVFGAAPTFADIERSEWVRLDLGRSIAIDRDCGPLYRTIAAMGLCVLLGVLIVIASEAPRMPSAEAREVLRLAGWLLVAVSGSVAVWTWRRVVRGERLVIGEHGFEPRPGLAVLWEEVESVTEPASHHTGRGRPVHVRLKDPDAWAASRRLGPAARLRLLLGSGSLAVGGGATVGSRQLAQLMDGALERYRRSSLAAADGGRRDEAVVVDLEPGVGAEVVAGAVAGEDSAD